jgi:hypothetical protein
LFWGYTYVLCLASQIADMVSVFGDIEQMTETSFLLLTNTNQALKIYVFRAAGAGRNLVNYRSRNRPETHALPA